MDAEKQWFVVYTKPRWEKRVSAALVAKGIKQYCPLNKVTKKWSDRRKVVLEPLFKGYVFVCPEGTPKISFKQINGILNFVTWQGKPAVVRESEIIIIKKFLNEFTDVEVTDCIATVDEMVVIKSGLLMNYNGVIVEIIGNKARVKIETMGLSLTAMFERKNLVKIGT